MRAMLLVALVGLLGCAPEIQKVVQMNDELQGKYQDQKELAIKLQDQQAMALKELDIANAEIQNLLDEMARITNNPQTETVTTPPRIIRETVKVEVPKVVPDGSMTSAEEQKQYNELLSIQGEVEAQRSRASQLQSQIEAAQTIIDGLNDPTNRYGWPALISAVLTLLGFITGRKWKKN